MSTKITRILEEMKLNPKGVRFLTLAGFAISSLGSHGKKVAVT